MNPNSAAARASEPDCAAARGAECPFCKSSVDTDSETCSSCGWPIKWIARKSDTPVPVRRLAPARVPYAAPGKRRSRFRSASSYVGAATVLAAAAWWLHQGALENVNMEAPTAARSLAVTTDSAPIPPAAPAMDSSPTADSREDPTVRARQRIEAAPSIVDEPAAGAPPASVAAAQSREVQAWRTADGKLYFGTAPPPGSEPLNAITGLPQAARAQSAPAALSPDSLEIASARRAPSLPAVPATATYAWRTAANCKPNTALEGMRIQVDSVRQEQTITGRLRNTGSTLIKGVTVCRAGACTSVAGGRLLQEQESVPFTLFVSHIDWDAISVECTMLERN